MAATAACTSAVEVDPEVEPPDYTTFEGVTGDTCPTNMCGDGNSPVIAGVYFWRLSLAGAPNPEGVHITGVTRNDGAPLTLELIDGDRLKATVIATGNTLEHEELEGVVITVSVPGITGPTNHEIEIARVMPNTSVSPVERFWVGAHAGIEAYDFYYRPMGTMVRVPLCSEAAKNLPAIDQDQLRAVVFGRELYNPATKAITPVLPLSRWINIACVNSAPYKMHKIGYTLAARPKPLMPQTTANQRKAMLNAWTANVCGDGTSYTNPGIPIRLTETHHALPYNSPYLDPFNHDEIIEFEALWNELGAVCMDGHRLDPWPEGAGDISCATPRPSCADMIDVPGEWKQYGHVATAVPTSDDP